MAVRTRRAVERAAVFHEPIAVVIDAIAADLGRGIAAANYLADVGDTRRPTRTHRIARAGQRVWKLGARSTNACGVRTAAIDIGRAIAAA